MLRRTPLKRGAPLRRKTRLRARGNTKYRRRERDTERMLWTKRQPCAVRELRPIDFINWDRIKGVGGRVEWGTYEATITPCSGPVEADHAGDRGLGQKADDSTCIPLCRGHHRERTDHTGTFSPLTRDEARAWRTAAIERTQAAWRNW